MQIDWSRGSQLVSGKKFRREHFFENLAGECGMLRLMKRENLLLKIRLVKGHFVLNEA